MNITKSYRIEAESGDVCAATSSDSAVITVLGAQRNSFYFDTEKADDVITCLQEISKGLEKVREEQAKDKPVES